MPTITVAEQGPPVSAALEFLSRTTPASDSSIDDTPLLKAIRTVLRGTDADGTTSIKTARLFTGDETKDHEVSWNAHHAVLTYGGVMIKRWSFGYEGESIQWACLAQIDQAVVPYVKSGHSAANHANADDTLPAPTTTTRSTFGPFHRANTAAQRRDESYTEVVPCVFIFLRGIGKIYLLNGLDYTFSLPFIVRKAWPVSPHGIVIQRVLEPSDIIEAEATGEDPLPTIFTMTSPFSEAAAVGHTAGIFRALHDMPAVLKDEEEHSTKPLKSIPPTEMIVCASHSSVAADARVVVTVDVEKSLLSVWHYVYIKPKGLAFTQSKCENNKIDEKGKGKQRQSMSGIGLGSGSRRTSAMFDGMSDRREHLYPLSPSSKLPEPPIMMMAQDFFELGEMPPLSSLPGMPPSLSTTNTMTSLISGIASQKKPPTAPTRGRRNSLSRNELSTTLDRMVLGGRMDDSTFVPIDHGRMKAAYWMECVFTHQIPKDEWVPSLALSCTLLISL